MHVRRVSPRHLVVALAAFSLFALPAVAGAQEERNEDWSFGAGIGNLFTAPTYTALGSGGNVLLVPQNSASGAPVAFSVERRLAPNLWIGLRADLQTVSSESNPPDNINVAGPYTTTRHDTSTTSFNSWGASLNLRYVLNPGSVVEFSPFVAFGLTGGSSKTTFTTTVNSNEPNFAASKSVDENTSSSFGPTGGVGFSVEAFLGRGVSLRFATLLASIAATSNESDSKTTITPTPTPNPNVPVQPTKETGSSTRFGLTLTPTLELRIAL